MSQRAPQTLSVKRKRTEAPVDSLIFDASIKRQRSEADIFFRRLTKPGDSTPQQDSGASTPSTERRFHLDPVSRAKSKHVFIERRAATEPSTPAPTPLTADTHDTASDGGQQPRPRKRPGTRAASSVHAPKPAVQTTHRTQPSEHDVRELEALSHRLEHEETTHHALHPHASPSKYKPKAPSRRFAEREPEKAAQLAARDGVSGPAAAAAADDDDAVEAMDLSGDDYVIDTYVREPLLRDSSGNLPTATGSVGYLVLAAEDDDWWAAHGSDESDKGFATDDDDSNAEEHYANDYPEDELTDDDEFDREPYKKAHRRGSSDEEFDAGESGEEDPLGSDDDEDDLHYKMTVPKVKRVQGYWGMNGGV
ncbi:hypothetical protein B5807_12105 [Epicoccum nigrum]|uniref:Transcription factor Iwr1 domain-containing protein n=1 Tax=Epicoccum nigrum TaxID=105696 RepID=A0A1Y2LGV6_EPING|nr:hypothetical protein B5807_12105 [Epicoccum nigrum]